MFLHWTGLRSMEHFHFVTSHETFLCFAFHIVLLRNNHICPGQRLIWKQMFTMLIISNYKLKDDVVICLLTLERIWGWKLKQVERHVIFYNNTARITTYDYWWWSSFSSTILPSPPSFSCVSVSYCTSCSTNLCHYHHKYSRSSCPFSFILHLLFYQSVSLSS